MGFHLTEDATGTAECTAARLPRLAAQTPIGAPFCDTILSTKYWDSDAKQAYYGYRYYGPGIGGWLSRDPIGENGGNNVYALSWNDPIGNIDPTGLACCNNTEYDEKKSCCCKDCKDQPGATGADLIARENKDVGIKICSKRGRGRIPGLLWHMWLEGDIPEGSAGFYPNPIGRLHTSPGEVRSPDNYAGKGKCAPIELSPCEFDITEFKTCVNNWVNDSKASPPDYTAGFYDCASWVRAGVANCKAQSKGKCSQP